MTHISQLASCENLLATIPKEQIAKNEESTRALFKRFGDAVTGKPSEAISFEHERKKKMAEAAVRERMLLLKEKKARA